MEHLEKLSALISEKRGPLLARWRQLVKQLPSAKRLDTPTLNDHIPVLLDELAAALLASSTQREISVELSTGSPAMHGHQRLIEGFDIDEVVSEYNILRGCIHDLADAEGLVLQGTPFRVMNGVLDAAIGFAVQTYATERAQEVQRRREEYLSFVAHDLRTPLTGIVLATGFLERCEMPEKNGAVAAQMLKVLRRSTKYLDGLVAKILDENTHLMAEAGIELARRDIDLWTLVEILRHDLQLQADSAGTELINEVPDEMSVYADASALRRVFQNLLANAIHYTPSGTVTVGAREMVENRCVECWVLDSGAGIPADRLDKVFEKLESDPENEKGVGLGLAVVKSFVEAHGGNVSVESAPGRGSKFIFTLPSRAAEEK